MTGIACAVVVAVVIAVMFGVIYLKKYRFVYLVTMLLFCNQIQMHLFLLHNQNEARDQAHPDDLRHHGQTRIPQLSPSHRQSQSPGDWRAIRATGGRSRNLDTAGHVWPSELDDVISRPVHVSVTSGKQTKWWLWWTWQLWDAKVSLLMNSQMKFSFTSLVLTRLFSINWS